MKVLRTKSLWAVFCFSMIFTSFQPVAWAADLKRPYETLVVVGSQVPLFLNAPIEELFVYCYIGGIWKQIAFQIDETDGGDYLASGNNSLNNNDEICFMAADMGDSVADHQWINDAASMAHQRYQIKVTNASVNPPKSAFAYIYRSSTLAVDPGTTVYMSYVPAGAGASNDTIRARGYILGHNTDAIPDYLVLRNGAAKSADILDRWKIRFNGNSFNMTNFPYHETENTALLDSMLTRKAGRIRTFRRLDFSCRLGLSSVSPLSIYTIYYPYHAISTIRQNNLLQVYGLDTLRQSFDLSSNAIGSKFYNRYNSNVSIDGVSDVINKTFSTSLVNWQLIKGVMGSVVTIIDSLSIGSVKEIYYKDDATVIPADTGEDGASYGDTGTLIADVVEKLSGSLLIKQISYYLGDTHTTAIVDSLINQRNQPLQISVTERTFVIPVELASFAVRIDNDAVELVWTTASETNNYGFEIYRMREGEDAWHNIAFLKGAGTTNENLRYSFAEKLSSSGVYYYRLKQIDFDGAYSYSAILSVELKAPSHLWLAQNYPNPFNPVTEIRFQIPSGHSRMVTLGVYNMLGQLIKSILVGSLESGFHTAQWDGTNDSGQMVGSGIYFLRLQTDQETQQRKMIKMQ